MILQTAADVVWWTTVSLIQPFYFFISNTRERGNIEPLLQVLYCIDFAKVGVKGGIEGKRQKRVAADLQEDPHADLVPLQHLLARLPHVQLPLDVTFSAALLQGCWKREGTKCVF